MDSTTPAAGGDSRRGGRLSVIPARAIDDRRLKPAAFRVLAVLGTYANRDGWCTLRLRTVGARLGLSPSTVSGHLHVLHQLGYVDIKEQHHDDHPGRRSNEYRVLFDADLPVEADRNPPSGFPKGSTADPNPPSENPKDPFGPDPKAPFGSDPKGLYKEENAFKERLPRTDTPTSQPEAPPTEGTIPGLPAPPKEAQPARAKKPAKKQTSPAVEQTCGEVFDAWKAACGKNNATKLTPKRKKRITEALQAGYTRGDLLDAVRGVQYDRWEHRGRNNDLTIVLRIDGERNNLEYFLGLYRDHQAKLRAASAAFSRPPAPRAGGVTAADLPDLDPELARRNREALEAFRRGGSA